MGTPVTVPSCAEGPGPAREGTGHPRGWDSPAASATAREGNGGTGGQLRAAPEGSGTPVRGRDGGTAVTAPRCPGGDGTLRRGRDTCDSPALPRGNPATAAGPGRPERSGSRRDPPEDRDPRDPRPTISTTTRTTRTIPRAAPTAPRGSPAGSGRTMGKLPRGRAAGLGDAGRRRGPGRLRAVLTARSRPRSPLMPPGQRRPAREGRAPPPVVRGAGRGRARACALPAAGTRGAHARWAARGARRP
ncbi:basic salivary proline-rich protein 2-like [Catharus ustulatus]|uniref:basic salivary proline-rich protein 2-like n=1 Tax=Catharus ustulatus TaxID=91951 RepID=UPI001407E6A2|nr:basic salivary proline-rich protein 2-like [Catharus ustulatus]